MNIDWTVVLEFLKVILTWPVCTFGMLLFVSFFFKDSIKAWIERMKIEYRGAVFSPQPIENIPSNEKPQLTSKPEKDSTNEFETSLSTKSNSDLRQLVVEWRANAYIWEYLYLNKFLVYNSRRFLTWLYDFDNGVLASYALAYWSPIIDSAVERDAIVQALLNHYLIQIQEDSITITPKVVFPRKNGHEISCGFRQLFKLYRRNIADA